MKPSYFVALFVLILPLLFNNCGAAIVLNENGSVAMSTFPADYESYGSIPSARANPIPIQGSGAVQPAMGAGSGLSPSQF